LEKVYGPVFT